MHYRQPQDCSSSRALEKKTRKELHKHRDAWNRIFIRFHKSAFFLLLCCFLAPLAISLLHISQESQESGGEAEEGEANFRLNAC